MPKTHMFTYPKVDQFATWRWPRKCFGVGQIKGSWTCHWENWDPIATEYVIDFRFFGAWNSLGYFGVDGMRCSNIRRQLGDFPNEQVEWLKGRTAMEMLQQDEWQARIFSPETNRMKIFLCRSRLKLIGWGSQLQYADKTIGLVKGTGTLQPLPNYTGPWPLSGGHTQFPCHGNCVCPPLSGHGERFMMGFIHSTDRSMEKGARGAALLPQNRAALADGKFVHQMMWDSSLPRAFSSAPPVNLTLEICYWLSELQNTNDIWVDSAKFESIWRILWDFEGDPDSSSAQPKRGPAMVNWKQSCVLRVLGCRTLKNAWLLKDQRCLLVLFCGASPESCLEARNSGSVDPMRHLPVWKN